MQYQWAETSKVEVREIITIRGTTTIKETTTTTRGTIITIIIRAIATTS